MKLERKSYPNPISPHLTQALGLHQLDSLSTLPEAIRLIIADHLTRDIPRQVLARRLRIESNINQTNDAVLPDAILTLSQAAEIAGVSKTTIWRRIHSDQINSLRLGREIYLTRADVEQMRATKTRRQRKQK